ncbi:hypothetical protein GCK72_020434 [Caenorhabditis remanei]|nr:hypothetical protein GCK72_020434 [Caenorhabditis remanei]KAF1753877.1 hypothetical protein GCK72_020434 [Caenorhabditis remanei]
MEKLSKSDNEITDTRMEANLDPLRTASLGKCDKKEMCDKECGQFKDIKDTVTGERDACPDGFGSCPRKGMAYNAGDEEDLKKRRESDVRSKEM